MSKKQPETEKSKILALEAEVARLSAENDELRAVIDRLMAEAEELGQQSVPSDTTFVPGVKVFGKPSG